MNHCIFIQLIIESKYCVTFECMMALTNQHGFISVAHVRIIKHIFAYLFIYLFTLRINSTGVHIINVVSSELLRTERAADPTTKEPRIFRTTR